MFTLGGHEGLHSPPIVERIFDDAIRFRAEGHYSILLVGPTLKL